MPWDPEVYNKFKAQRYEPFYDMIAHLHVRSGMHVLDLGCGTGELTNVLADRFPAARVLGIDSAAEMLAKASHQNNVVFEQRSIEEQLERPEKWDIIVANAALQWVGNHEELFPRLISRLAPQGQLAVQMPSQHENLLNQLLDELVHEFPYNEVLQAAMRRSPVRSLDNYTKLLFDHGAKEMTVYQKVYPIIAETVETLYDFISGSALVPYMEQLPEVMKTGFSADFKQRIARHFTSSPMVYPFKRIIMVASF